MMVINSMYIDGFLVPYRDSTNAQIKQNRRVKKGIDSNITDRAYLNLNTMYQSPKKTTLKLMKNNLKLRSKPTP